MNLIKWGINMNAVKVISSVFNNAQVINFDDESKFVFISDCHRGDGNWGDNFGKNQSIYFRALNYYYNKGYTYFELGDGDELWENRAIDIIKEIHSNIFWLLSKFYTEKRLFFIYGNHDMDKKNEKYTKDNLNTIYDNTEKKQVPLFPNIKVHEGIILQYKPTEDKVLLLHGHQGDYFNNKMWKFSRTLVRYLWRPLEIFGVNDPSRAAKNYKRRDKVEKNLAKWAIKEKKIIIAGHTHRPVFPQPGEIPYFNDGSCVHPRCITAIEIAEGNVALVKWQVTAHSDGVLIVERTLLEGPVKLTSYFENMREKK